MATKELVAISNAGMKQFILSRIQDRVRRFVGVKDDVEAKFGDWFQELVAGAMMETMPPPTDGGGGAPPPEEGAASG